HYTLYLLFGVAGLACLLAILAPLYFFHREGLKVQGTRSLVGFFSALGVGFMFIELGVIQRLAVYLGHPMYSLTVVLGGLLLFTGLGSYLAGRSSLKTEALFRLGMIGTTLATLAWVLGIKFLLDATRGLPDAGRIGITLATLLPLGLLMGIPFATGLRQVGDRDPRFIPWAWGINGITSVMASILAIILAMRIGFQMVLVLGAVTYVAGYFAVRRYVRTAENLAEAVEQRGESGGRATP